MKPGVPHVRCLATAALGLLLGVAAVAHGQDAVAPVVAPTALDPATSAFLELAKAGGLPAVLAGLGWLLGRGGGVPITVQLHPDDRELLKRIARHLAAAVEPDPVTDPGRRPLDREGL